MAIDTYFVKSLLDERKVAISEFVQEPWVIVLSFVAIWVCRSAVGLGQAGIVLIEAFAKY